MPRSQLPPVHDETLEQIASWPELTLDQLDEQVATFLGDHTLDVDAAQLKTLSHAVQSPNAHAALKTYASLHDLELPETLKQTLVLGVTYPRTAAPEGRRGVLTLSQAVRAAGVLTRLPPESRRRVDALLKTAGQPGASDTGPIIEEALILKALGARPQPDKDALTAIEDFAKAIHGLPRYVLVRVTSLLDLDSRANTAAVDSITIDYSPPRGSQQNKGLLGSSCGPAAVEVLLGEADPIFAFHVHAGNGDDDLREVWLRHFSDPPNRRRGMYEYFRLRALCHKLVQEGPLTNQQRLATLTHCRTPNARLTDKAKTGLAIVHQRGGFPTPADIAMMQTSNPTTTDESDADHLLLVVHELLATPADGDFTARQGNGAHFVTKNLAALAKTATNSGAVVGSANHWWAVADARQNERGYQFLLHDTWTGVTAWVDQKSLTDGSYQRTVFGWPHGTDVDTIIA